MVVTDAELKAKLENVIKDTRGAYDNSTGIFTAPRSRYVTVDARYSISPTTGTTFGNGTSRYYSSSTGVVVYPVSKGDTVSIVATPGVTANMSGIRHNNVFSLILE